MTLTSKQYQSASHILRMTNFDGNNKKYRYFIQMIYQNYHYRDITAAKLGFSHMSLKLSIESF